MMPASPVLRRTWDQLELRAFLWALVLQAVQLWLLKRGLPSDPDFIVLPLGGLLVVQAYLAMAPYWVPWLGLPLYALCLWGLGVISFRHTPRGRLRPWLCGVFYYLTLLLTWPLFFGVIKGCLSCQS